jgi:hypothetical protein
MHPARYFALVVALVSLLVLAVGGDASASNLSNPPVVQLQITAVSSSAICVVVPCSLTVTLTYNEAVGFTADAYRAFSVNDETLGTTCTVTSLTTSPIVAGLNVLLLHATCYVNQGDRMHLAYVAFLPPSAIPGYVYSLALPHVPALSPQLFDWIQGPTTGCPPICTPAA